MRSGADYVAGLSDGRAVYLDGKLVEEVRTHPAFAGPIEVIADTYDQVGADAKDAYVDPKSGEAFSGMWRIPRSAADLTERRLTHERWARPSFGLMGRTPDHVASLLTAFAASKEVFGRTGERYCSLQPGWQAGHAGANSERNT